MKSVIIIPTYNERENVTQLIPQICDLPVPDLNILVVDDNSPDGTGKAVESLMNKYAERINILKRPGKLGLGSAYIAGFKWALQHNADLIFEMDADGSHNPADIPRLITAMKDGFDVAIGSRRIKGGRITGWNLYRHLASWGAMTTTRLMLGLKTHDVTAGFRCYKNHVLKSINLDEIQTNGYAFQEEMIWLCEKKDFLIKEIPITFKDRELGESKLNSKDIREFFITLIKLRLKKNKN